MVTDATYTRRNRIRIKLHHLNLCSKDVPAWRHSREAVPANRSSFSIQPIRTRGRRRLPACARIARAVPGLPRAARAANMRSASACAPTCAASTVEADTSPRRPGWSHVGLGGGNCLQLLGQAKRECGHGRNLRRTAAGRSAAMPNRAAPARRSSILNVAITSASPLTAVSMTMSSSGSVAAGRQR